MRFLERVQLLLVLAMLGLVVVGVKVAFEVEGKMDQLIASHQEQTKQTIEQETDKVEEVVKEVCP